MARERQNLVAVVGALLAVAGCSSTSAPAAHAPAAQTTAAAITSSAPPATVPLLDAITAAGGRCAAGAKGQDCTINGTKVTVATGTWESEKDLRGKACSQGYVNATYKVITDGRDVITTDFTKDHAAILATLRQHGATSAREANYCP